MTLVTWVKYLEGLARYFRTRRVVHHLVTFIEVVFDRQYVRWLFWVDIYYGSAGRHSLPQFLYFVLPAYAPFILYEWLSKVSLNYRVRRTKYYENGVQSSWATSQDYSSIYLSGPTKPHGSSKTYTLGVGLELESNGYLHIDESTNPDRGSMATLKLLPQLLL